MVFLWLSTEDQHAVRCDSGARRVIFVPDNAFFFPLSAMAPRKISRLIFLIFTKKHGLHVQADATKYLETLLEDDPNVQETLEKLIKLYRKRFAGICTYALSTSSFVAKISKQRRAARSLQRLHWSKLLLQCKCQPLLPVHELHSKGVLPTAWTRGCKI